MRLIIFDNLRVLIKWDVSSSARFVRHQPLTYRMMTAPSAARCAATACPPKLKMLSVIVPTTRDGEEILRSICEGIREQAEEVAHEWELFIVDHGSDEETRRAIADLTEEDCHVHGLRAMSGGRSSALALGYRHASGEVVLTMESDQDNDVKEIAPLLKRLSGDRQTEGDRWQNILPRGVLRRMTSRSATSSSQGRPFMLPV